MHTRRLVAFLLGVWIGGILFVAYTINANFSTTRSILENPREGPRLLIDLAGRERAATLLQYNTAEANRTMVESWEWFQLALGLGLVGTLPFAMRLKWAYLIAAVIMLLIATADRVLLTPDMVGVGRLIDMAGGDAWTQDSLWKQRRSLRTLQQLYWAGEIVKGLVGLGLTAALLTFRGKSTLKSVRSIRRRGLEKVDAIDDSDYSHVDR